MGDITENSDKLSSTYKPFINQYAEKIRWVDKSTKNERKSYLLMKCSVSAKKNLSKRLDVRYHLVFWFGVTIKGIAAAWTKL